ncbi:hypothetical protein ACFWYW_11930 [Nonomuraea sp. NPDC059023]|uniref:hypothetical protein n=1 Tax=unclassified Nonomuraea TaxID=2593643 RepID=UPI003673B3B5
MTLSPHQFLPEHLDRIQDELRDRYPQAQINLSGRPLADGSANVSLDRIVLPKEARGQGHGSAILRDLHTAADAHGWTVSLTPSTDYGGTKSGLDRFYRRHGYTPNKGRNKDYEISNTMIRRPGQ